MNNRVLAIMKTKNITREIKSFSGELDLISLSNEDALKIILEAFCESVIWGRSLREIITEQFDPSNLGEEEGLTALVECADLIAVGLKEVNGEFVRGLETASNIELRKLTLDGVVLEITTSSSPTLQ